MLRKILIGLCVVGAIISFGYAYTAALPYATVKVQLYTFGSDNPQSAPQRFTNTEDYIFEVAFLEFGTCITCKPEYFTLYSPTIQDGALSVSGPIGANTYIRIKVKDRRGFSEQVFMPEFTLLVGEVRYYSIGEYNVPYHVLRNKWKLKPGANEFVAIPAYPTLLEWSPAWGEFRQMK